jgi:hypothetical protein
MIEINENVKIILIFLNGMFATYGFIRLVDDIFNSIIKDHDKPENNVKEDSLHSSCSTSSIDSLIIINDYSESESETESEREKIIEKVDEEVDKVGLKRRRTIT